MALKPDGGLKILQGELVLPLAMIFIMVTLIPFFRRLRLVSVYTYLERRFNPFETDLLAGERDWLPTYGLLVLYCGLMAAACWAIPRLF